MLYHRIFYPAARKNSNEVKNFYTAVPKRAEELSSKDGNNRES